jgi:hypothetical protein
MPNESQNVQDNNDPAPTRFDISPTISVNFSDTPLSLTVDASYSTSYDNAQFTYRLCNAPDDWGFYKVYLSNVAGAPAWNYTVKKGHTGNFRVDGLAKVWITEVSNTKVVVVVNNNNPKKTTPPNTESEKKISIVLTANKDSTTVNSPDPQIVLVPR